MQPLISRHGFKGALGGSHQTEAPTDKKIYKKLANTTFATVVIATKHAIAMQAHKVESTTEKG